LLCLVFNLESLKGYQTSRIYGIILILLFFMVEYELFKINFCIIVAEVRLSSLVLQSHMAHYTSHIWIMSMEHWRNGKWQEKPVRWETSPVELKPVQSPHTLTSD
jgi:hypothetical protein